MKPLSRRTMLASTAAGGAAVAANVAQAATFGNPDQPAEGSVNVTDPNARGIRYEIDGDGMVSMIHVGGPAIQLVEGCS